jgi:hypothetical protein
MPSDILLPIKVVFPRQGDYQLPGGTGGEWEPFVEVTDAFRGQFVRQVEEIRAFFEPAFESYQGVPAVAKVKLRQQAVAKTYRPYDLFNDDTCPIIGSNKLGELYVSVQPTGLDRLSQRAQSGHSRKLEAHLSTVERIRPYAPEDVLGSKPIQSLQAGRKKHAPALRFRLFRHPSPSVNKAIDDAFIEIAKEYGIQDYEPMDYAEGLSVYCLRNVRTQAVEPLVRFVGTQSLSLFPDYRIVRTASRVIANVSATGFPPPEPRREYGVVGLFDSGTDPDNRHLQAWVVDRLDFVPRDRQDNNHGSFVAGLLVHGKRLNNNDPRFPTSSSRIVDVVAFDKDGEISEYDVLTVLDEGLNRFDYVKVWNLSLAMLGDPCTDQEFSMLASALDERARKRNVLFVVAAGNYPDLPLRSWPPEDPDALGEADRICPPADAVRAITVGSVAHLANSNTRVGTDEPSPFSRRGPGPAYLIKPELSQCGGNCDEDGNYVQTGVISIDASGHIAENIGTSFACPLVSTIAADVQRELSTTTDSASPTLVKALMVHGAFLKNAPFDRTRLNYDGLGTPPNVEQIINCRQSSATLILQAPVRSRPEFGKRPFPMPACLSESGKLNCEVFMTLLYDPPLDRGYGVEYCRCNVNASLGTVVIDPATGKESYNRQVPPYPKELCEGYEEELIKHGFKWAPLKLYYRRFMRGPADKEWRLTLDVLNRAEFLPEEDQEVILVITIRDPAGQARVYDALVREMNRLNWGAQDLGIRSRARLQP